MQIGHPTLTNTSGFIPFDKVDIESSISARFERQVLKFPDNAAIKEEFSSLTYLELNLKANSVAHEVLANNHDSEAPVIIIARYGIPVIIAILGVLKTGRPFVTIDASNPLERLHEIFIESDSDLIITDNDHSKQTAMLIDLVGKGSEIGVINVDKIGSNISTENPGISIPPDTYAQILYTSGSTGKPKGIIRNHRFILNSIRNATNNYQIAPNEKILLITSISFGASSSDIFGALLNGGTVYPFPLNNRSFGQLTQLLINEEITMCHFVATTFRHFIESLSGDENFQKLRMVRLGGEAIHKQDVDRFKEHFSDHCVLRIGYASTETGSICWNFISKDSEITGEIVPVGHPLDDVEVLIFDEEHQPVQPGDIGEIAVRSSFLSQGYWKKNDLNQGKFLPDPEGGDKDICLTGDLGRVLPDGTLEYHGRKDDMVKIRGLRIETREIEELLLGLDSVKDAVIIAQEDRFNEKRLVAYMVLSSENKPSTIELREVIANKLPDYMVPSSFIFLDSLPLTSSGKVNKLALPTPPEGRLISGQDYVAPRNDLETSLIHIFEKHLDVNPIGVKDNFFELGGHSLTAIRIVTDIEGTLHRSIPISEFIKALTVEKLSDSLQTNEHKDSYAHLISLQTSGSKPPLFCVPPSAATAMRFEKLTMYLGSDQPVYGFEYAGMNGKFEPFTTIPNMARAYIQELRLVQPEGPYYICGLCFGGTVAYEIAQQLVHHGEEVAFLGLLDSNFYPPKKRIPLYYYILIKRLFANIRGKDLNITVPSLDRALDNFEGDDILRERFIHVFTINHIARVEYSSPPYPGLITRFMTDSRHARRATKGWAKATSKDMDIVPVPGHHGREEPGQSSFMSEPNIQVIAAKLKESLEKAQSNRGTE